VRVSSDRIAVVRAHPGVGPMLAVVPALRALRGTAPRAHIALVGLPTAAWLLDRFPTYLNELITFPGFPGMPGDQLDARATVRFLAEMHERELALAIQLHDDGLVANAFTQLLGARHTAGAHPADQPPPEERDLFIPWPTDEPEAVRLLKVLNNLGAHPPRGAEPELPLDESDHGELAQALAGELPDPGEYVCLHPGPGPAERFAALGSAFRERDLRVILIGGEEHAAVAAAVADGLDPDVTDLSGALTLGATAALLKNAALLVADGLSLAQVAAAVHTPSIAIAPDGADTRRWTPYDGERHRVFASDPGVDDLVAAADELAGASTPRAA